MKTAMTRIFALLMATSVYAADGTWTNASDALWTNTANWAGGVPGAGDIATFNNSGNSQTTIDLSSGSTISARQLLFTSSDAAAYTIGSGGAGAQTLNLNEGGGGIQIDGSSPYSQTIDANLTLGTGSTGGTWNWNIYHANRTLTLNGSMTKATTGLVTFKKNGLGTLRVNGDITDMTYFRVDKGTVQIEAANLNTALTAGNIAVGNLDDTGTLEFFNDTDQSVDKSVYLGQNTAAGTGGATPARQVSPRPEAPLERSTSPETTPTTA